jgi:hypothetical protein
MSLDGFLRLSRATGGAITGTKFRKHHWGFFSALRAITSSSTKTAKRTEQARLASFAKSCDGKKIRDNDKHKRASGIGQARRRRSNQQKPAEEEVRLQLQTAQAIGFRD